VLKTLESGVFYTTLYRSVVAWIERKQEPNRFLDFASGISNRRNKTPLEVAVLWLCGSVASIEVYGVERAEKSIL
jgi:hypothetical protein